MPFKVQVQAYDGVTTADSAIVTTNYPPPASIGTPSNVAASVTSPGNVSVEWDYATLTGDTITSGHFLVYVGVSPTPDWGSASSHSFGIISAHYGVSVATALTGTVYIAVRASNTDGTLTSDTSVIAIEIAEGPPRTYGGLLSLSNNLLGTQIPTQGRIRNLSITQSDPTGVSASYVHEGAGDDHQALMYVNGQLASIDVDEISVASGFAEGFVNVNLVPALNYQDHTSLFFDDNDGSRVLLTWPASTSEIAGYRIYDYPAMTERDTVTEHRAKGLNKALPTTGTGRGRVSSSPVFTETDVTGTLKLVIDGAGSYHFDFNGVAGASDTFSQGTTAYYEGIPFVFEDDVELYETGDEYHSFVGVQTEWLSPELAPGEYQFAVTAYDTYGRESSPVVSQIYEIVTQADAVTPSEAWDNTAKTLTISFAIPTGAASVNLYTNFLEQEEAFTDYVFLEPIATTVGTSFVISFGAAEGTFLYYLRPVTDDGVELQDFTLYTVEIPTPAEQVSAPARLAVTAVGLLNWSATWAYYFEENDQLAQFTVHRIPAAGVFTYDLADTVATIPAVAAGFGYEEEFTFDQTAETEAAGVLKIQVVAHSTSGTVAYSEIVEITTQGAAVIGAPGQIIGGAA